MGVGLWMTEELFKFRDRFLVQVVLDIFRRRVDVVGRQACFAGEEQLPESMGPDDLPGPPLSVSSERQLVIPHGAPA